MGPSCPHPHPQSQPHPQPLNLPETKKAEIVNLLVLGTTSIGKIPKISAPSQNILYPLPLFEIGPYRQKLQNCVPNSNYKVNFFFSKFQPLSPISSESRTSPILSIEVAPYPVQYTFQIFLTYN